MHTAPHMSIPVLEKLRLNEIIGYALPSQTSGTTQPLELSVFLCFKSTFRNIFQTVTRSVGVERTLDEFGVCKKITADCEQSFSSSNIISGFREAGCCLLDEYRLFA